MRKFLSLLLSIVLLAGSVSLGLFSYALETDSEVSVYDFADELSLLIRNYNEQPATDEQIMQDVIVSVEEFFTSSDNNESGELSLSDFETCRLIIKTGTEIDYKGAIDCVKGYNDLYILQYATMFDAKIAYEYYLTLDYIEYVEPDIILRASNEDAPGEIIDTDDLSGYDDITAQAMEWLQNKIGFSDIKEELEQRIKNDYVLVAVLDSGVDLEHEQLVDRLVESDVNLSASGERNNPEDDYGHGTHVAGIIANNTLSNVKIKPYKVLDYTGSGSLSVIALAVDMAVSDGAKIINMSLTGEGESPRMTEAVNNAVANSVNVVVAAGNKGADLDRVYYSPASIPSAITVSATDENDKLAYFSNYDGPVDIAAMGVNIKSCYPNNSYVTMSGTSMAAPQVVAGLAIVHTIFKDISAEKAEQRIKEYAIPVFENVNENHFGAGMLYLKYLLDEQPTTANPVFSVDSCTFSSNFEVTITCPEPDAKIFYILSTYGKDDIINRLEAEEYTKPITISVDTKIYALAYTRGKKPSDIVEVEYDRNVDNEDMNYEINILGYITGYFGDEVDLYIPEIVQDKTVKGIASSAFKDNKRIRNVHLPDTATKINNSAFANCSALVSVSGNGIDEISSNGFENSSIQSFDFPNLTTISYKAFSGCSNLKTSPMPKVEKIGDYAFEKTPEITYLDLESVTSLGSSAFAESGLQTVNFPNVTSIGLSTFSGCEDLVSVSIPQLTELGVGAFRNCTSLKSVNMPLLTDIGANAFRNTGLENFFGRYVENVGSYAFAENNCIASIILPLTKTSGINAFANCPDLQVVMLPAMEELNNNSFYQSPKIKMLYLPSVKTVSKTAFIGSSIEYLRFDSVENIKGLPDTLKAILLPSTLQSVSGTVPKTDFIVFGYENTYAQQYAISKNKEFRTVPAILYETSGQVNPEDTYIVIYAMGFNCTYQWYKNDKISNVGGTPIEGEQFYYYQPTAEDNAVAYYCVVTSNDGKVTSTITTNPIVNAPEYRPADLEAYNELLEDIKTVDRESVDEELLNELDELLNLNVSGITYANQYIIDEIVKEIEYVLDEIKNGITMGDASHDHKVSAYDVRMVLCYAAGTLNFSNQQIRACDLNGDGQVTAIDARMILQQCVEA